MDMKCALLLFRKTFGNANHCQSKLCDRADFAWLSIIIWNFVSFMFSMPGPETKLVYCIRDTNLPDNLFPASQPCSNGLWAPARYFFSATLRKFWRFCDIQSSKCIWSLCKARLSLPKSAKSLFFWDHAINKRKDMFGKMPSCQNQVGFIGEK